MSLYRRRDVAMATLLFAAAACGPFRRGSGPPDSVVIFNNQSMDQADVYAVGSSGQPVRIGTVFSGRREMLRVPVGVTGGGGTLNVLARIFASSRVAVSGPISLSAGDTILVTLPVDEKLLTVLPAPE